MREVLDLSKDKSDLGSSENQLDPRANVARSLLTCVEKVQKLKCVRDEVRIGSKERTTIMTTVSNIIAHRSCRRNGPTVLEAATTRAPSTPEGTTTGCSRRFWGLSKGEKTLLLAIKRVTRRCGEICKI
jgi:hypothetical protein